MSDGTSYEIDIPVNAPGVEPAAAKLAQLADRLTAAGQAATQAADAVKAGEAAYKQAEASASRAALAVEKIGLQADAQRGKMKAALDAGDAGSFWRAAAAADKLAQKQAEAVTKATAAKQALASEAAALDRLNAAAVSAKSAEDQISKAQDAAKKSADAAKKAAEEMAGSGDPKKTARAFGDIGGPLGVLGQKFFGAKDTIEDFGETLGSAGPYAIAAAATVAVIAAVAALTAAVAIGTAKIAIWAVGLADAARSSGLLSQGIAQSVAGGKLLDAKLDQLASSVPIARDELSNMAADLAKTGLRGQALADSLQTAAEKAAQAKFGPNWSAQMLSVGQQSTRLQASISKIFSGLKIDKLLEGFSKLVDLFDENSASAKAIKVVFESVFQPLIDLVTAWLPKARTAFIEFEIQVMKALIAIKPFGSDIVTAAEAVGILAALIVGVLVVAIGLALAPFILVGVAITAVIYGILKLVDAIKGLGDVDLGAMGKAMIDGLINGITGAASGVVKALTGTVNDGIDAAKKALGIASPSKVFAEIGMHTAAGMAGGVDSGSGDVQDSMESMVAPPDAAGGGGGAAPASQSGGGINIENLNVTAPGGTDPKAFAEALRDALLSLQVRAGRAVPA